MPRILIIEDDSDNRDMFCEVLKLADCEVETAASPQEGLEMLERNEAPDILLLDLHLQGMSQEEFHSKLRALLPAKTKLLLVSGAAAISAEAEKIGAWKFMQKPISIDTLLATVKTA